MKIVHFNLAFCVVCLLAGRGITQTTVRSNEVDGNNKYGFFEGMIRHLIKMGKYNIEQNTASWHKFVRNYNKTVSGILRSNSDLQKELSKLQKDVKGLFALSNSTDMMFIKAIALAKETAALSGDALQIFSSLSAIVTDFSTGIRTAALLLLDALGRNFDNLEATVKYPPTAIYIKIVQVYRAVIKQLTSLFTAVSKGVTDLAGSVVTDINLARNVSTEINRSLMEAARRIVLGMQNLLHGVAQVVADMGAIPRWTDATAGIFKYRLENIAQSAEAVMASVVEMATAPIRRIAEVGNSIISGIGNTVGNVVKTAIGLPFAIIRG